MISTIRSPPIPPDGENEVGNENYHIINREEATEEEKEIIEKLEKVMQSEDTPPVCDFKKIDNWKIAQETAKVNNVLKYFPTDNITETNKLIKSASLVVAERIGAIRKPKKNGQQEPGWKRRIQGDIKRLQHDISILNRKIRGELRKEGKYESIRRRYGIDRKGIVVVFEELKQRVLAKKSKISRFEQRIKQYRQNRMFQTDQKRFYQEINGDTSSESLVPDAEESRKFWGEIWDQNKEHNRDAEWLKILKQELHPPQQENLKVTKDKVKAQCRKMKNWKAAGPDGVQGYWVKKLTETHQRIADQLDMIIAGQQDTPSWMTLGRTILALKDAAKGNSVDNYRPISCLPIMWKLLTGILSEDMYSFLEQENILTNEQKGCKRKSRGTKDQLLIDKMVLRDSKRRSTNLAMGWIDYRKAYDMIPHSWILECIKMFGIAKNVGNFLEKSMEKWRVELTSSGQSLGQVNIKRGIFQGDSLSPLLFVLCMIPMTLLLRKMAAGYQFKDSPLKINHLLYMDDLKLYAKDQNQLDTLINTVHIFSSDIGMEFGMKKCGVLILKRGKVSEVEGITLPTGEVMKTIDEEGYKYLGMIETDKIMEEEMRENFKKEYKRRLKLVLKSKLNGRNKFQAINTWAIALFRYGAGIINWRKDELEKLDRKTRKILTLYGAHHPKSDVDRLYLPRNKGGRGLISCEGCVKAEENNLGWYIKNSTEPFLTMVNENQTLKTETCIDKNTYKSSYIRQSEDKWHAKQLHGQFCREETNEEDKSKKWLWLSKSDLKPETESLICAAQEQALRTNYIKHRIDKSTEDEMCRMCGKKGETVWHLVSECEKMAQKEYKRRHDNVCRIIHWELCGKHNLERAKYWYDHQPAGVIENDSHKILWDFMIQCDHVVEHRKPDIVLVNKEEKTCLLIDIACPGDIRIKNKEDEKLGNYEKLKREVKKLWNMDKVEIVPIIVGALGKVTKNLETYVQRLGIVVRTELLQKTTLLGTARILRKVLET